MWAGTAGAGNHQEDQLLLKTSEPFLDEHTNLQLDEPPMMSPAAQQLDAQLATEDVETVSDASEPSEDSIQAEAVQPMSVDAAEKGSDEEDDTLGIAPAGSSGAVPQEARSDEVPLYPGDTDAQDVFMVHASENAFKCFVSCMRFSWLT